MLQFRQRSSRIGGTREGVVVEERAKRQEPSAEELIGRAEELAQLEEALALASMATVCGPPGVGKTRLAEALAARRDGEIVATSLEGLEEPERALAALIAALELPANPEASGPPDRDEQLERVCAALGEGDLELLVLDGAEGQLGLVELMLARLKGREHAEVLITSRRAPEGCPQTLWLEPLALPQAVALLVASAPERRRAALSREREALEALAEALERLPLALRLVASRLGMLSPKELLERLREDDGGGEGDLLERAIASSWELLSSSQREVMMQCAVFAKSFRPQAAEAIVETSPTSPSVLEELEALCAHSLLETQASSTPVRCRMLESVRAFALRQLGRHEGFEGRARGRHMAHFASRARAVFEATGGRAWRPEVAALLADHDNLRAALDWASAREQPARLAELALGLALTYWRRGELGAIAALHARLDSALEGAEIEDALATQYALVRADGASVRWDPRQGIEVLEEQLARREQLPEPVRLQLLLRGVELCIQPALARAEELASEALELARQLEDRGAEAHVQTSRGHIRVEQRTYHEALALLQEAASLFEEDGDEHMLARALVNQSYAWRWLQRPEEANEALQQAARIFRERKEVLPLGHTLRQMAWSHVDAHAHTRAEPILEELLELAQRHALGWLRGIALLLQGHIHLEQRETAEAIVAYTRAELYLERTGQTGLLAAALLYHSLSAEMAGDEAQARRVLARGERLLAQLGSPFAKLQYLGVAASWQARDGDLKAARATLDRAREMIPPGEHADFYQHTLTLYECHVALPAYERAHQAGKSRKSRKLLGELMGKLSALLLGGEHDLVPPMESAMELRVGWALLEPRLPETIRRRFDTQMKDPRAESLIVDTRERAYRPPGQLEWVDMSRRETPFRLLEALVEHRIASPGDPLDPYTLFEQVWPDEQIMPDAAQNRLYVTVAALRRDGLREMLQNISGGYLLDPEVRLLEV